MKLEQPTVKVTCMIAKKTDKVDSNGEPLYSCGGYHILYPKAELMKAFEKSGANIMVKDGDVYMTHEVKEQWARDRLAGKFVVADIVVDGEPRTAEVAFEEDFKEAARDINKP